MLPPVLGTRGPLWLWQRRLQQSREASDPHPRPQGVKHATTSAVVIRAWWQHAPLANPAIATGEVSEIKVLDIDGDKGGFDSLKTLEREHGRLPHTLRVVTASGEHLYFAYPGVHLKNTSGKLGPGLDVRCCGGYVVTVAATHSSGRTYTWKDGHRPGQAPLATPPAWLLPQSTQQHAEERKTRGYAAAALASEEQQLLATPEGQRNQRLNLAAFRLARFVASGTLNQADVEDVLVDAARRLGLPDREAHATIASGLRAGAGRLDR
jgi:Bifunctional DNA primase/polymerase, N-terminal